MVAELMDGKNIGVIESGGGARFLLKSSQTIRITRKNRRQNFDCDFAPENRVASPVDFSHTACSHHFYNLVSSQFCAGSESHGLQCRVLQETVGSVIMSGEKRFDFLMKVGVSGTDSGDIGCPCLGRELERSIKDLTNLCPAFRLHLEQKLGMDPIAQSDCVPDAG